MILLLMACATCDLTAEVTPGCGVETAEGAVRLGETRQKVERRLGEPSVQRDLGALGVHADYGETRVVYREDVVQSVSVPTDLSAEQVETTYGAAVEDPILGTLWLDGLGFDGQRLTVYQAD